jgi:HSP20 family protein
MSSRKTNGNIPVRIYESDKLFGIIAPMAGLAPDDIHIRIAGRQVTIDGKQRGPHQHDRNLLKAEWSIGPFHRELEFPETLNGPLANATYGNGVLVLTIPKANSTLAALADFTLERIGLARGERVGHVGHGIQETNSRQHHERLLETGSYVD